MTFKTWFFSLCLLTVYSLSSAHAAAKNSCDDKCLKENALKKKWQTRVDLEKSAIEEAALKNIEIKKFSSSELRSAGNGKQFFALRVDYADKDHPVDERLTTGDDLCQYLGFDKAQMSRIDTKEIGIEKANQNGLVVQQSFLGGASKGPTLYDETNQKYVVRPYHEITCARALVKGVAATEEELNKVVDVVVNYNVYEVADIKDNIYRRPAEK